MARPIDRPKPAATIPEFCADHRISRTHFYALTKDGKGPRLMKLGRRVLISSEAAADWRRRMEEETAGESVDFLRDPIIV